jgi:hypothetical protein
MKRKKNSATQKTAAFVILGSLISLLFIYSLNIGEHYESSLLKLLILILILVFLGRKLKS